MVPQEGVHAKTVVLLCIIGTLRRPSINLTTSVAPLRGVHAALFYYYYYYVVPRAAMVTSDNNFNC